ncbi:hypothetical protein A8B78_10595 [Jannaschia sp. EhC01]|nr:hypothetical protein A8B78_10595 [Jannaschia sp. EhC01]
MDLRIHRAGSGKPEELSPFSGLGHALQEARTGTHAATADRNAIRKRADREGLPVKEGHTEHAARRLWQRVPVGVSFGSFG